MSIRDTVHISTLHPTLHPVLAVSAAGMGYRIVPNRTNTEFIQHLRADMADRRIFAADMTAYYVGLNRITRPPIPAAAYSRGIVHSLPRI